MKRVIMAAACLWLAGAGAASANDPMTCAQLRLPELEVTIEKWFKESWGFVGKVTKAPASYFIKTGERIGASVNKGNLRIFASNAAGQEYGSYDDITKEKNIRTCGRPTEPKRFRTNDCKDISGEPIEDCKPGDPWNLRVMVIRGMGAGGGSDTEPPTTGSAPACSDRAYCTGSGFKKMLTFTITSVSGSTIGTSNALCSCAGRCGEVRRDAPGLAEFIGDVTSLTSNSVTVDKGNIRQYTAPKVGEEAYLVWKPCGN